MIKHVDLFSGIGGFALALDRVFGEVEHTFVEIDPFCQAVLKKHWPNSYIHGDIKTFTNPRSKEPGGLSNSERQESKEVGGCDILTGGFPCQPFSQAGQRKGTEDNRYLWPEMFRVIQSFKPAWVVAENVRGLVTWSDGMVLEQVCADLESEGYEVQPLIIPAVAVNAPHRRDRIWFIANRTSEGWQGNGLQRQGRFRQCSGNRNDEEQNSDAKNSISEGSRKWLESSGQVLVSKRSKVKNERPSWEEDWVEVATKLCRVDDGLPARMDGLELSAPRHRKERLKSLGNAIVPQVAEQIFRVIPL